MSATSGSISFYGMGGGPVANSPHVHRVIRLAMETAKSRRASGDGPLRVVVVPTAKFDLKSYREAVDWAQEFFSEPECVVQVLHDFQEAEPNLVDAAAMIDEADLLFFCGGSTEQAIAYWRETGLRELLVAAFMTGTTSFGISAGLIVWGSRANTDSDSYGKPPGRAWEYKVIDTLGVLGRNLWVCPHAADNARQYTHNDTAYGEHTTRRDVFVAQLGADKNHPVGLAVDGDIAIHVDGDTVTVIGAGRVTTHTWRDGVLQETAYTEGQSFPLDVLSA